MLKLKVIACDVLNREISYLCSRSKCYTDVAFLHQGLHCTPDKLREMLQQEVDRTNISGFPYDYYNSAPEYDYIIIGYGLCSNGIVGISSSRIPLVIPKGHDCITLLLGSKERYSGYFDSHPGTYWFSGGWIERGGQPGEERYNALYQGYINKYGEDNAQYLMDMEQKWMTEYNNAAYVKWECLGNTDFFREYTQNSTRFLKWDYSELDGDVSLLDRILNGIFNDDEVLIVPKGKKVCPSYDKDIIKFE